MPHHTASQVQTHGHDHAGYAHVHPHAHTQQGPDTAADMTRRQQRLIRQWRTARVVVQLVLLALPAAAIYVVGWTSASLLIKTVAAVFGIVGAAGLFISVSRSLLVKRLIESHRTRRTDKSLITEGFTLHDPHEYDLSVGLMMLFGGEQRFREAVFDLTELKPGEAMLDVGCGTGSQAVYAAQVSGGQSEIVGIDAAPEMIEYARQKAERVGATVVFRQEAVEALSFDDEKFDVVMNSLVMHHLPGDLKQRGLAEMYRVMKPGGRLLIVEFEPPPAQWQKLAMSMLLGPEMMHIATENIAPLLHDAGFTDIDSGRAGHPMATFVSARKAS